MQISKLSGEQIKDPIYQSSGNKSITSLSTVYDGPTIVYLDEKIGHLQTNEVESIDKYYDEQYQFFNESEEDDILYKIEKDRKIFRQQHQVETLMAKVDLQHGMQILDYGCAKGTVLKRMHAQRPDINPYLFDVSTTYTHLWQKFLTVDHYASYQPKKEWAGKFDLITSFFAFEHTPDPLKELSTIRDLLKEGGLVYLIVPNVFENVGDFIVADHVHHYSEISLRYMLAKAGFETLEIDTTSHFAAFIIIGKKKSGEQVTFSADKSELEKTNTEFKKIAAYWEGIQLKILEFENALKYSPAAIYGAGVYGNFIGTTLRDSDKIECFIDQNPLLQGKKILNKPVFMPNEIPSHIKVIYVGLNPKIAKNAMSKLQAEKANNLSFVYL
ncbi:MAG TPA: class I SAM-dependent methyltransferase [Puia sp.]|nr:class I SAM-dependent methyltransferase [Puia sp.]